LGPGMVKSKHAPYGVEISVQPLVLKNREKSDF
jgi:hypothetical protein